MESEIILDHATKRSRGFGFVVFDSEQVVDDLLSKGNMIDFAGAQVSSVGCQAETLVSIILLRLAHLAIACPIWALWLRDLFTQAGALSCSIVFPTWASGLERS